MYYHQEHLSGLLVASKKVVDRMRQDASLDISFDIIEARNAEDEKIYDRIGGALEQRWCLFSNEITIPDNYTFMI